ncbi:zf-HC2 domain-containing protein [Chitinophaga vietnamensis]|uniref:zf-HC2 domain-containing protein n=1 Tax=Chitinophaga vietnamensis TaxID=2593957 RepID=UPI001177CD2F|nr:tetratricopeptide repeat protein [Chitinophaga vietnamensis]
MPNNQPHNEKILKIFSGIRCLNKDQLPRYMEGRLTDVEKHLVEQHLTDCDLCFEALQALEKENNFDQYNDLTGKLQRYIHQSIQPVSYVQKVAKYTRKERNKENLLVYFWLVAFAALGVSGIYVLRGHLRNQPVATKIMAAATPPKDSAATITQDIPQQPIITENHTAGTPATHTTAATTPAPATTPATAPAPTPAVDSAKIKAAAAAKIAARKKAAADSLAKKQALARAADSIKKVNEQRDKEKEKAKADSEAKVTVAKEQPAPEPKKTEAPKKETPASQPPVNSDEYLYRAAMLYQQQGNLSEAIDRYRRIESVSTGKYVEMARYQLAICYRSKGQMGKARRMFREVIRMDGSMKNAAQQALDSM